MKVEITVSGIMEIQESDLADLRKANWEDCLGVMRDRGVVIKYEVRELYVSEKSKEPAAKAAPARKSRAA